MTGRQQICAIEVRIWFQLPLSRRVSGALPVVLVQPPTNHHHHHQYYNPLSTLFAPGSLATSLVLVLLLRHAGLHHPHAGPSGPGVVERGQQARSTPHSPPRGVRPARGVYKARKCRPALRRKSKNLYDTGALNLNESSHFGSEFGGDATKATRRW